MSTLRTFRSPSPWDTVLLEMAASISKRSKDPNTQVGAILCSPDKRKVSWGYNGFPESVIDDLAVLASEAGWRMDGSVPYRVAPAEADLTKHDVVIHAEVNAILHCFERPLGWSLYCTHEPCANCAKIIVASGVTEVVTYGLRGRSDLGYIKTENIFKLGRVTYRVLESK